jgi:hypothetical protein
MTIRSLWENISVLVFYKECTFHKVVECKELGLELVSEALQLMLSLQIETKQQRGIAMVTQS